MSKIKICGLTRRRDIDTVNAALPDYIGFVFAKSRRQIDEEGAATLKGALNPFIKAVGVFVNEDMERIRRLSRLKIIDIIQLHGDEDIEYIKRLKDLVPNEIIKALRIRTSKDVRSALNLPCDYLLFDTWHDGLYGGTGAAFDWSIIGDIKRPYFLAGGINLGNAAEAIKKYNPYSIDISSGVESEGLKDPNKINKIVSIVRNL